MLHRHEDKDDLLTNGMVLRGVLCQPRDKNSFVVCEENGQEKEIPSTRLAVGNIPISFSNEEILRFIEQLPDVKTRSRLLDERTRDDNGKLSHFKTGRRFIYIDVPKKPLPKTLQMGIFNTTLFHKEQKVVTCFICLLQGHHSSICTSPVKCRQCFADGHKAGDAVCTMTPPPPTPAGTGNQQQQDKAVLIAEGSTIPAITRWWNHSHTPTRTQQKRVHPSSCQQTALCEAPEKKNENNPPPRMNARILRRLMTSLCLFSLFSFVEESN